METSIPFPLYAFGKDDNSIRLIESSDRILYHMEAIDIENEEYFFWDALGKPVRIAMKRKQVDSVEHCQEYMTLHDAFLRNAASRGVTVDLTGRPEQAWSRLDAAERRLSAKQRSDRWWAVVAAVGLLTVAAFIVVVIHPGGFEGQLGWAWALMPGMPVGLVLADCVYKVAPSADRIVLWSSALGITFLWYFVISYAVIKTCRLLVRAIR